MFTAEEAAGRACIGKSEGQLAGDKCEKRRRARKLLAGASPIERPIISENRKEEDDPLKDRVRQLASTEQALVNAPGRSAHRGRLARLAFEDD